MIKFLNLKKKSQSAVILSAVILVVLISFSILLSRYSYEKKRAQEFEQSSKQLSMTVNHLNDSNRIFKTKLGKTTVWASEVQTLYMDKKNLVSQLTTQLGVKKKELHDIGIKIKDIQSVVSVNSTSSDTVHTVAYIDSIQSLHAEYCDSFITIATQIFRNNQAVIRYTSRESYDLFNYVSFRHHFLFFRWGRDNKYLLLPHNPHTKAVIKAIHLIRSNP